MLQCTAVLQAAAAGAACAAASCRRMMQRARASMLRACMRRIQDARARSTLPRRARNPSRRGRAHAHWVHVVGLAHRCAHLTSLPNMMRKMYIKDPIITRGKHAPPRARRRRRARPAYAASAPSSNSSSAVASLQRRRGGAAHAGGWVEGWVEAPPSRHRAASGQAAGEIEEARALPQHPAPLTGTAGTR